MSSTAHRRSLTGSKIGNYAIGSVLGEGGMGVVYLAEHPIIGKRVAIKILHLDHAARADAAARCFLEARAVNEIRHPNVVDVIDCGIAELGEHGSVHYLLMEYLEGEPLRALIRRGPLPPARATAIAIEVGRALAAAHAKGIIHRDVKPENIFLAREGPEAETELVKVLDFGIAKLMDGRSFGGALTESGVTLGTPQYMAPEQLDGEDIDGRVDVYALGIVLYEMVTGAAPFANETTARGVWRRMNELPTLPPEIASSLAPGLEALLMRTLDPDRVRRPDMAELVRVLVDPTTEAARHTGPQTVRLGKPASGRLADAAQTLASPSAKPWIRWIAVGAVIGAGVMVAAYLRSGPASPPPKLQQVDVASMTDAASTPDATSPPNIVTIQVTSTPAGAEVYVGSESARRGVTPIALSVSSVPAVEIRLTLPGFAELRRSISALQNHTIELELAALPISERAKPLKAKRPNVKPPVDAAVPAPALVDAGTALPADAAPKKEHGDNLIQPHRNRP